MKVVRDLRKPQRGLKNTVVTIGAFDGLHTGHQKILGEVVGAAKKRKWKSAIVSFNPHPSRVLSDTPQPLLLNPSRKLDMLEQFGIDLCLIINFSRSFSQLSPDDFVKKVLLDYLKAKLVVVGFNYVFGKERKGNAKFLSRTGEEYGFDVQQVEPVRVNGEIVSSTRIRELVKQGEIAKVNSFLGRPHEISGIVTKGESRGHLIGHPTANLRKIQGLLPAPGVYAGFAVVGGSRYKGALNLGWRPTVSKVSVSKTPMDSPEPIWEQGPRTSGTKVTRPRTQDRVQELKSRSKKPVTEIHILGFNDNIYGQEVIFDFTKKIRDEIAFNSIDELRKQIETDIETVNEKLF